MHAFVSFSATCIAARKTELIGKGTALAVPLPTVLNAPLGAENLFLAMSYC
jgi:hypothetical protein